MTEIELKINVHCVRYGRYGRLLTHVAASVGASQTGLRCGGSAAVIKV
ncbi:hypothetical protein [Streptomyces kasugaensis]|nr:hypothetical protein [Streptomyces kasugaensis]